MNESLPVIIEDLAYIMIVAGISTVLFKKLKQPLVLGYIFAGFLAGPNMPYMPTIGDVKICEDLGQIGVIFIMFTLGLEFSFKKIIKMGFPPILCVCMIMGGMIGVGNLIGNIFEWSSMDSLFLGGMLCMSSTAIIYKAFDEMGLRHKKFAGNVLSVLILEDIMGILLLVVLSTIAATRRFEGTQLINSMLSLGAILILWFLVGVFVLPLLLKRYKRFMNRETLMIVSLALCFLLVYISAHAGYSPAFGAFMMGSILSETVEAEEIEHAVSPVKDLFGAIFFVSVGMMVSPAVIVQYWPEILVLTLGIIIGQSTLGTFSYLITGSSLKDSIYSGFSMAQIGEFAFIIASLGTTLHVTSPKLYPIIVAVSIITTFFTPFMIKAATPVCNIINGHISGNIDAGLYKGNEVSATIIKNNTVRVWKKFLLALLYQTVAYTVISLAVIGIILTVVPIVENLIVYCTGNADIADMSVKIGGKLLAVICISPFLRAICMRKNRSEEVKYLIAHGKANKILVRLTVFVRMMFCMSIVYSILSSYPIFGLWINIAVCIASIILIMYSRTVKYVSISIERIFKQNLYRKDNLQKGPGYARMLKGSDLHMTRITIPDFSLWSGMTLQELNIGHNNGVHVASIIRGSLRINIPGGSNKIFSGDTLEIVGDDDSIDVLSQRMISSCTNPDDYPKSEPLVLKKFEISEYSNYVGCTLGKSAIREQFHCTVIGFEDNEGNLLPTDADQIIIANSRMWVVGEFENLELLELRTNPPEELLRN